MQSFKLVCTCYCLFVVFMRAETARWSPFSTSNLYANTKLVTETESPFPPLNFSKGIGAPFAIVTCSILCAKNATCLGFNIFFTNVHYICEFLIENFCSNRQRIALQVWPGGTVWDKMRFGAKKACIDQRFQNKSNSASYCNIGRPGCRSGSNITSQWPGCNNCFRTCADCYYFYNPGVYHNCTIWPEGPSQPPIFSFCSNNGTFIALRGVDSRTGAIYRNDVMTLRDIYRLCRLRVYKVVTIYFDYESGSYFSDYNNFYVDENGTLMNMTLAPGQSDDGFKVGNNPLKPSPWIQSDSACGSFWMLNSTQSSSTLLCPGGGISMFGKVNLANSQTGIRWPKATDNRKLLFFTSLRFNY